MKRSVFIKSLAVFVCITMLYQIFYPTAAFALTGGPSQPEMNGFEPVETTQMVDLSSGSFTYNIPLMDVGGYPINLAYHSGTTMDEEASWVGLGWNINPGEINRQMRGLPDDFKGDSVTKSMNFKPNITGGLDAGAGLEIIGLPINLGLNAGIFYNNYRGPGLDIGLSASLSAGIPNKGSLTGSLGLDFNTQNGVDVSWGLGIDLEKTFDQNNTVKAGLTVGKSYNNRTGMEELCVSKDLGYGLKKDEQASSTSSSITLNAPSYVPTIGMPIVNNCYTLHGTTGIELFGLHGNGTLSGYVNIQQLATNTQTLPSYGFMYSDQSQKNPIALLDFNREKDVPFLPHLANLPITQFTYDLYNVSGQGVYGQFRPFRGDVGVLYDHQTTNQSTSIDLGVEFGLFLGAHFGIDGNFCTSNTVTDQWTGDNEFGGTVSFQSLQPGNINYEPFYFKGTGEKTVNDTSYYKSIGDVNPFYVKLDRNGSTVTAKSIVVDQNGYMGINSNLLKTRREKRNRSISMMTAQEANYFGLDKSILNYPYNKNVYTGGCAQATGITQVSRLSHPLHHTSEITVTNPDGKRYVYGLPAYTLMQKQATFAIARPSFNNGYHSDSTEIAPYNPGSDNTTGNTQGIDNYFESEQIPQYAHSYLLTGVLSSDYVDLTGDGITDDDLGEAIKINYTNLYGASGNPSFNWRVPFEANEGGYQEYFKSDPTHDKDNYMYGQKEVWYVHSIESKTMVAQFILENRNDALGVAGENGGSDSGHKLKRLKEIDLYSKADLIKNGVNAVPVKVVHFTYDYTLCPGTPNSLSGGKLTLKKVWFTYGNNTEGSLNSYQFGYSKFNPAYAHNHYDRWGYYKYNVAPNMPSESDFPYTLQDSVRTNKFASAWELNSITLPSGGQINIKYQANDYAYVQNQRANEMFLVKGVGNAPGVIGSNLYSGVPTSWKDWITFNLPVPVTSTPDFYNKYLDGIVNGGKLYFRFLVDVDNQGHYEYVPGYADVIGYTMVNSTTGAIKLGEVSTGNAFVGNANPISIASWQYVRLNLPQYAYPGCNTNQAALGFIESLLGIITTVVSFFTGFDEQAVALSFGKRIVPNFSYIRLDNPNYKKLGGGCRVSEIDISDSWSKMVSGQSSFTYGQTYDYTTTKVLNDGLSHTISSGVATNEPQIGEDESPLHQPLPYSENYLLAPNNNFYTETPLGEDLYPAAQVVYSQVTVRNLQYKGVTRTGTGSTVNRFYTGYDFPVLNSWTYLDVERVAPSLLSTIFAVGVKDFTTASQGFSVEVNDMPGKQKSQEVYDQNGSLISSISYHYKVDNDNSPSLHLNNNIQVMDRDGIVRTASVGKDIDTWEDMREQDTQTSGVDAHVTSDFIVIPLPFIPPFDIPDVLGLYSSEHVRFRSSASTKYIFRSGILDKITKTQNGSISTTQNLLFDGETGDVLLSQTNNEFNAPIYNFSYPAYWGYDGMGPAYKNIAAEFDGVNITNGVLSIANPQLYFAPGDELEYFTSGNGLNSNKLWVTQPKKLLIVMDASGNPANLTGVNIKIIRSGRRNMSETPIATLASEVSPISGNTIQYSASTQLLQAGATIFNNAWRIPNTDVEQEQCQTVPGPNLSCLAEFLDSVSKHHQMFATPSSGITLGKYATHCSAFSTDAFYALTSSIGVDEAINYEAQIGDCVLTITSSTGKPISLDNVTFTRNGKGCLNISPAKGSSDASAAIGTACISCMSCQKVCLDMNVGQAFNPYATGMLGNWRPQYSYVYYDDRNPSFTSANTRIWKNGYFDHFTPFWTPPAKDTSWTLDTVDKNWTWSNMITMYNQKGSEVESKDRLGRYSSALYGYQKSLPVAVSTNAQYQDIAFDGFEDYGFDNNCNNPCDNTHFSFIDSLKSHADTTSLISHSGKYSMRIDPGHSIGTLRQIINFAPPLYTVTAHQYFLQQGGEIPQFSPVAGNYFLSAWVKESAPCGTTGYKNDSIVISFGGSSARYVFKPMGSVIEGWQRFGANFTVPASATSILVTMVGGTNTTYYDDIRLQPFSAEMTTYVYDPSSLRTVATLDENNYATFYEYNDEGILMRVKKETDRGVMTIKESRSSYPRK
jgi:hypothetical protein